MQSGDAILFVSTVCAVWPGLLHGLESKPIPVTRAAAQSLPSWGSTALEDEFGGLDQKTGGICDILIYCLHSTEIGNCALRGGIAMERWDDSRNVATQQKMLTCQ